MTLVWRPEDIPRELFPSFSEFWGLDSGCQSWIHAQLPTELSLLLSPECGLIDVYIITTSCHKEGVRRAIRGITSKSTETFQITDK